MRSEHRMTWLEQDAFTGWRHVLCYVQRPGVRKAAKRRSHQLDRRKNRATLARNKGGYTAYPHPSREDQNAL